MQTLKGLRFILFGLLFCSVSGIHAAEFEGKVDKLYVNSSGTVLYRLLKEDGTGVSACASTLWPFRFGLAETSAKEWWSILVTANVSGKKVRVGYKVASSGSCTTVFLAFMD